LANLFDTDNAAETEPEKIVAGDRLIFKRTFLYVYANQFIERGDEKGYGTHPRSTRGAVSHLHRPTSRRRRNRNYHF